MSTQQRIPTAGALRFMKMVREMRKYQCEYFSTRSKEALAMSKKLEILVDDEIKTGVEYLQRIGREDLLT